MSFSAPPPAKLKMAPRQDAITADGVLLVLQFVIGGQIAIIAATRVWNPLSSFVSALYLGRHHNNKWLIC